MLSMCAYWNVLHTWTSLSWPRAIFVICMCHVCICAMFHMCYVSRVCCRHHDVPGLDAVLLGWYRHRPLPEGHAAGQETVRHQVLVPAPPWRHDRRHRVRRHRIHPYLRRAGGIQPGTPGLKDL